MEEEDKKEREREREREKKKKKKKVERCTSLCMYQYNQKTYSIPYAITCQSCAHTKLLPDAVAHAVSLSVSAQNKCTHALSCHLLFLAKLSGSFTCHCGNTGWNGHQ